MSELPGSERRNAVIYCRVSSTKQRSVGTGLESQERRCRDFAEYKGYEIVKVFQDDITGKQVERPGMKTMLAYLRRNRRHPHSVIIDDISRLARDVSAHIELRATIARAGALLESPSIEFGDDPDSILVENLMASVSQHQREKNGEQTRNRMRARTLNGYWVFQAPIGYRYEKSQGQGKVLVRDEPVASVIQEGLEGYASGRFQTKIEVLRFFESRPEYPRTKTGQVHDQKVFKMLRRVVYTGYVEAPRWGIAPRPGHHEPIISYETFQKIQQRLGETANVPARKNLNEDFPLRGFVACGDCGSTLTAAWAQGRNRRYAYYLCQAKGCASYGKSIKRDVLEGEFEALLQSLRPTRPLFDVARAMLEDLWDHRLQSQKGQATNLEKEIEQADAKIAQLLDRIVDTEAATVIRAYENRIKELETHKAVCKEKIATVGCPVRPFEEVYRTAMAFLVNPCNLWDSSRLEDKRTVLKLAFTRKLAYVRNQGYRTADLALPFKVLASAEADDLSMVGRAGIEPATT